MPFASYKDFKDCTNKNKNKKDPEAYCGAIKHKVEDKQNEGEDRLEVNIYKQEVERIASEDSIKKLDDLRKKHNVKPREMTDDDKLKNELRYQQSQGK